ncbi:vomeronasal type-2 receptor 1-like [Hemitrygon akajei]|uniref:vomeronasal type-2 receptor 1-like n=1 Tax=Hemitrygon akajei TaxID=2704970 RepID=UPI003BF9E2A6
MMCLSSKDIPLKNEPKKFTPRFLGTFEVEGIINPTAVRLKLPRSMHIHPTFHVSQLKTLSVIPLCPPTEIPAPPGSSTTIRHTLSGGYWMCAIGEGASNSCSTGKCAAQRSVSGFHAPSFWTPPSSKISIGNIRTSLEERLEAPVKGVYCHGPVCFDLMAFRMLQTMIFTIEEINRDKRLLPNITLGYKIHDDCDSPEIATKVTLALLNGQEKTYASPVCDGPLDISGIVGGAGSSVSIAVARTTGPFRIPLVSYFSTCMCLNDKTEYPTFHRTIPSDEHQSKALGYLVQMFGWTWIGTINSDDDYGNSGIKAFIETAVDFGVCIAFSESFHRTDPGQKITRIVQLIKETTAKVVVAFAGPGEMRILFEEVLRQNLSGLQWVGSEAWITADIAGKDRGRRFLVGAIGTTVRAVEVPEVRDFLLKVHPSSFPGNPLVREFWETTFRCTLSLENETNIVGSPGRLPQCSGNESLHQISNTYTDLTMDGSSYIVYKAVYSFAHALHDMFSCEKGKGPFVNNTCALLSTFQPWQLLHYLSSIFFTTKVGEKVYFDEKGNPTALYDFVNWQMNAKGSIKFRRVGYYNGSAPSASTDCIKCPPLFWSNKQKDKCIPKKTVYLAFTDVLGMVLVIPALVGVCMSALVAVLFFKHRETPLVKANNSELSFLLLFALSCCFLCSVSFIGEPSEWSCMLRHTAFGVSFVLCISCVLVKTILVLSAFKATHPSSNWMKWFRQRQQRISVFLLASGQGLICAVWLLIGPPFPVINTKYYRETIILECDTGSSAGFYLASSYIGVLSCICFVLAFLARKLPDNFNEAKCITFSMLIFCAVWVTFIPVSLSSPVKYTVAVEVFAILASSFGLLLCIFAPKCFIILVTPERNTKKHIMGKNDVHPKCDNPGTGTSEAKHHSGVSRTKVHRSENMVTKPVITAADLRARYLQTTDSVQRKDEQSSPSSELIPDRPSSPALKFLRLQSGSKFAKHRTRPNASRQRSVAVLGSSLDKQYDEMNKKNRVKYHYNEIIMSRHVLIHDHNCICCATESVAVTDIPSQGAVHEVPQTCISWKSRMKDLSKMSFAGIQVRSSRAYPSQCTKYWTLTHTRQDARRRHTI